MENKEEQTEEKRRSFLRWLTTPLLALWGVGFIGALTSYLKPPSAPRSSRLHVVPAGEASSLEPGVARFVRHGNSPFFVLRLADGEIIALSALCTHFRCVLHWSEADQILVCPCHNGAFNAAGDVISGLPNKALANFPVEVRRGEVLVRI